jgi:hypothetical protein
VSSTWIGDRELLAMVLRRQGFGLRRMEAALDYFGLWIWDDRSSVLQACAVEEVLRPDGAQVVKTLSHASPIAWAFPAVGLG